MSWKKALIPLACVPLIILLAYGFRTDPKAIPSPLVQKTAPDFRIAIYDGDTMSLEGLKGKPVVLNFWASWCYPACYEEAPLLEATWRKYKDRGLTMVGVDIQDKEEAGREFLRRFNFTFPNGPDPGSKISIDYGVYGVPETFFIDRQGRIAYKHVGALSPELIEAQVESILKEK
ncbi:MAG TPA: TlpA disulfide reductase family protein [Candidatus Acidoferrum sp.]|nr:TlpA disulfide reductase family protein [Candidatus Methylomirabilis sp.]HWU40164.1 TlpA disulfide reductase family protein [Candidatus Acidoferrum sp.]